MELSQIVQTLRRHQPFPKALTPHHRLVIDDLLTYFDNHPDHRLIPLYLGFVNDWEDFNYLEHITNRLLLILKKIPSEKVWPELVALFSSQNPQTVKLAVEAANRHPSEAYLDHLTNLHLGGDVILRELSAQLLNAVGSPRAKLIARDLLHAETNDEVRDILLATLEGEDATLG